MQQEQSTLLTTVWASDAIMSDTLPSRSLGPVSPTPATGRDLHVGHETCTFDATRFLVCSKDRRFSPFLPRTLRTLASSRSRAADNMCFTYAFGPVARPAMDDLKSDVWAYSPPTESEQSRQNRTSTIAFWILISQCPADHPL